MSMKVARTIVEQIFRGKELIVCDNNATLWWSRSIPSIEVPINLAFNLISRGILILDGGNFETGEKQYVYNPSLYGIPYHLEEKFIGDLKLVVRELKLRLLNV